ncbi:hypothetical protein K8Q98_00265 [Candidatus Nomurabacteria bacterium]|nr:hypothetical protein [Candidatus Nomurabacteria bacterium]
MGKKELFWVGIIVSLLVLYVLFHTEEKIVNYPAKNNTIVAFGDSLIEGVGSSNGGGFIPNTERELNIPIINKGRSGDTTSSAISRLDEVISLDPGIVMLLLGGNDILRRIPKEETFKNLGTIIEKLQNNGTLVVLLGVRGGVLTDGYENDFENLAEEYKTAYLSDVLEKIITKKDLMSDGIHPNDKGYEVIASRVIPIMKKVLGKN